MQDRIESVETLWADFATPIRTAEDYVNSLRGRRMNVSSWESACRSRSITQ